MSNFCVISDYQLRQAADIIEELVALTDPSDYLKGEALEVIDGLRDCAPIDSEAYIKLTVIEEKE